MTTNMDVLMRKLHHKDEQTIWVFGYGSLMWNPNFDFQSKIIGHINGFVRRFWQGNTTHRGTKEKPGRVATLAEENGGTVWGVAFQITGVEQIIKALDYLYTRESVLGGYETIVTKFYPRGTVDAPMDVLVFTATTASKVYMGPAETSIMAQQIIETRGQAGSNKDYVTKIADFVRTYIPEDKDEHLFSLDRTIRYMVTRTDHTNLSVQSRRYNQQSVQA